MSKIQQQLDALADQQKVLEAALEDERARKTFKCGCGKMHQIKRCTAIQTHWYTEPHGCMGGDYWNTGELRIICPNDPNVYNRLMFDSKYAVPYDKRTHYAHDAEEQFSRMYRHLFKEVIQDYKDERLGEYWLNYYVDNNHKKFGIDIGFPFTPRERK